MLVYMQHYLLAPPPFFSSCVSLSFNTVNIIIPLPVLLIVSKMTAETANLVIIGAGTSSMIPL
jgi:hypothetical protein